MGTYNTNKSKNIGEISLRLAREGGGNSFISLATGKQLHMVNCNELPIYDNVIDRFD